MIFKDYVVKSKDTYETISKKLYGLPVNANTIDKVNGISGDLKEGLKLKVPASIDDIQPETDNPVIIIDNAEFTTFRKVAVNTSLVSMSTAIVEVLFNPLDKAHITYFKIGKQAMVYLDGKKALTGIIRSISTHVSGSDRVWVIGIKSIPGILIDTHIPRTFFPLEYLEQTIREIVTRIADGFGVSVIFGSGVGNLLNVVLNNNYGVSSSASIQETAFDYIVRLCSSRGLIVTDDANGNLVIDKYTSSSPVLSVLEGSTIGFTDVSCIFDYDEVKRNYHVFSQLNSSDNYSSELFDLYPIPVHRNIVSIDVNSDNITTYAKWVLVRSIGQSLKITIILPFYKFDKVLLNKGDIMSLKIPSVGLYEEEEYVIESISKEQTNIEQSFVTLTIPGAFTGDIPESLPLMGD